MEEKRNSEIIRRLVLAKMLYQHGCTHAARKDSVSRMLAIHHFDNAVEMALLCIATKLGTKLGPKPSFEELLKPNEVPLKEQISGLHKARNGAQHQGDIPSTEVVIKYKGYTEDLR